MLLSVSELAFHQRLGRLIDNLEDDAFWPQLASLLGEVVEFDTWVAMLFRPVHPPLVVADSAVNYAEDNLFDDYMRGLYLLDPFYAFGLSDIAPGVYRLDEVAPDSFRETEYYHRYFSRNVVKDELQFLLPLPGIGTLSLALGSGRRFTDVEIGACCLYAPWLLPLMRRGARLEHELAQPSAERELERQSRLEEALRQRGEPPLTRREVEVALLILAGHSTKGVARQLGISLETAKVHRRNLYGKLGVTSQAALFLLFVGLE
ncbi:helix-turn-helix transcriptional regulator [Crenobacter sp. SG2303]|uniref:Helix-turn-helix transcriptional regulator n=1 Tax=Crenobacter oryzisoli TaxID=3056844 RepID=A0ABT7XV03_9NEIS|nr:helix-turn-helix transcriptional regulator [Crenobacter sp. SG2303]MDN0077627.1 helix-turn-helix transcriptional regulator [Crenobacter sp. SG2303]